MGHQRLDLEPFQLLSSNCIIESVGFDMQGDPSAVPYAVENVRAVLGKKPVFGICMGHQLLGQAFGGATFKLKFGHHGGNHPIRFEETSESLLTCFPAVIC